MLLGRRVCSGACFLAAICCLGYIALPQSPQKVGFSVIVFAEDGTRAQSLFRHSFHWPSFMVRKAAGFLSQAFPGLSQGDVPVCSGSSARQPAPSMSTYLNHVVKLLSDPTPVVHAQSHGCQNVGCHGSFAVFDIRDCFPGCGGLYAWYYSDVENSRPENGWKTDGTTTCFSCNQCREIGCIVGSD